MLFTFKPGKSICIAKKIHFLSDFISLYKLTQFPEKVLPDWNETEKKTLFVLVYNFCISHTPFPFQCLNSRQFKLVICTIF